MWTDLPKSQPAITDVFLARRSVLYARILKGSRSVVVTRQSQAALIAIAYNQPVSFEEPAFH